MDSDRPTDVRKKLRLRVQAPCSTRQDGPSILTPSRRRHTVETVIRNLPIYGHATNGVRFLLQRALRDISRLTRSSQAFTGHLSCSFPCNSRYVPILHESHQGAWFSFPAKTEERRTLVQHGSIFISDPSSENPPKRYSVRKVLSRYSLTDSKKRKWKKCP